MPTSLKIRQTINKPEKKPSPILFHSDDDGFYHTTIWRKTTRNHRKQHPFCQYCLDKQPQEIVQGSATDHTLPRLLFPELSLTESNLKTICKKCDGKKRQIEAKTKDRDQMIKLLTDAGFYKG
jgi:5-methylcytosine-specific restriction endonuclease McrA